MTGTRRALGSALVSCSLILGCGPAPGPGAASPSAASGAPGADTVVAPDVAEKLAVDPTRWPFGPGRPEEELAAQLARLAEDPGPLKSNWVPPGQSERYGHAEGMIDAPYEIVRARLADFAHYKDLAGPKFKSVRVVGKEPSGTDVYFQLPIMKGLVTIWYVTRFPPPQPVAGGGEVVVGTYVKGNIKTMHIALMARPAPEPDRTVLECDIRLEPNVPAPQGALDKELRDACGDAVKAVRRTSTAALEAAGTG